MKKSQLFMQHINLIIYILLIILKVILFGLEMCISGQTQYSNKVRLNGYSGQEKRIDMNVFNGDKEKFEKMFN